MTTCNIELEKTILHWKKGEPEQNFGDFLSHLIAEEAIEGVTITHDCYRIIGSCIANWMNWEDLRLYGREFEGSVAYWGCGARDETPLVQETKERFAFYGVRGPLSRDLLGLAIDTPMMDTALLLPILYSPNISFSNRPEILCIPHINDRRNIAELVKIAGADRCLSPVISNDVSKLRNLIDAIASADFVLSGSLHGAIIACAYDVPFCFWDTGHLDIPFKFRDFAASVEVPTAFARTALEGKAIYDNVLAGFIRKPPVGPFLDHSPFTIKEAVRRRAFILDEILDSSQRELRSCRDISRVKNNSSSSQVSGLLQMRRSLLPKVGSF
jgi:hypothetical protein